MPKFLVTLLHTTRLQNAGVMEVEADNWQQAQTQAGIDITLGNLKPNDPRIVWTDKDTISNTLIVTSVEESEPPDNT